MRKFGSGATRNLDDGKLDYEGFLSPLVLKAFGEYMHTHRIQGDGDFRPSDNWQKGIPLDSYMKSGWRHHMDWWMEHRGLQSREGLVAALCGVIFNASGYLHELLKGVSLESLSDDQTACDVEPRSLRSDIGESVPCMMKPGSKPLATRPRQTVEWSPETNRYETFYSTEEIRRGVV